jgi:hypothetical protein
LWHCFGEKGQVVDALFDLTAFEALVGGDHAVVHRLQEARGTLKILDPGLIFGHAPTLLLSRTDAILSPAASAFVQHVRDAAEVLKSISDD